jgi:hypothetical protein
MGGERLRQPLGEFHPQLRGQTGIHGEIGDESLALRRLAFYVLRFFGQPVRQFCNLAIEQMRWRAVLRKQKRRTRMANRQRQAQAEDGFSLFKVRHARGSNEAGQGGGFGVEGGDGFDEAGDGEGIADAALAADKVKGSGFAGEADGNAHEGRDSGAVDLRNVIEGDDDFAGAPLNSGLQSVMELLGGLANSEAPVNIEKENAARFADVNFHGDAVGHRR